MVVILAPPVSEPQVHSTHSPPSPTPQKHHWIRVAIAAEDFKVLRRLAKSQDRSLSAFVRVLLKETAEQAK